MGKDNEPKDNEPKPSPFIIDRQSLYLLHPSDMPGVTITTARFNGKSYELWEQAVQTTLKAKNKLASTEA